MLLIVMIKALSLIYNNGAIWCSVDDIVLFLLLLFLFIMILPFAILGDIFLIPITILIFLLRKHNDKKYFNKKYTLKDFINEVGE